MLYDYVNDIMFVLMIRWKQTAVSCVFFNKALNSFFFSFYLYFTENKIIQEHILIHTRVAEWLITLVH